MCGIAGLLNYNKTVENDKNRIWDMTKKLNHRGPDALNILEKENLLLGHARLIVVDPEGGKQPMSVDTINKGYSIVYNGELYNTEDIRKELIKLGHQFESYSDTEVLLHAYIEWRENCVLKLNGIYAFAVWDEGNQRLFLARDRAGVKPLFYTNVNGYFLFASEIKSILASKLIGPVISEEGLLQLFSLGPSRSLGKTIYDNIFEVKPGEYMVISKDQQFKMTYWDVKTKDHTENTTNTTEHINFLVEDAIKRQLVSDVPLCTFLSGGLDSSIISSVASQHYKEVRHEELNTYCIDYKGNDLYFQSNSFQPTNDTEFAKRVSHYIGSQHNNVMIGTDELIESLYNATYANDYPGMADIDSSLSLFCGRVKEKFTVALSGECADEIFGGYPWYTNPGDVNGDFFPWIRHMDLRQDILSENIKHLDLTGYAKAAYDESIRGIEYIENESGYNKNIRRLTYLNYKWFMLTLLTRKDRMSMQNSLEVRVPFADHRILEYAYNIPWPMKYLNNTEKGILRSAMKDYLPKDVLYRKKSPYPKTYNPEYTTKLIEILKPILDDKNALINQLINRNHINGIIENRDSFKKPWFGQLMKTPQFIAYLIQLHYFLEMNNVQIKGV